MKISSTEKGIKIEISGDIIVDSDRFAFDINDLDCHFELQVNNTIHVYPDKEYVIHTLSKSLGYSNFQQRVFRFVCWLFKSNNVPLKDDTYFVNANPQHLSQ